MRSESQGNDTVWGDSAQELDKLSDGREGQEPQEAQEKALLRGGCDSARENTGN